MRAASRQAAEAATPPARAVLMRGISLLDIAMWDALGRARGLPVWALLGGARTRVPVMPVVGYGASVEAVTAQCADLAGRGFRTIKLMINGSDFAADRALMKSVRAAIPDEVAFGIDAHWSWKTIEDGLPTCLLAQELGAAFVEDPFLPQQWRNVRDLQGQIGVPIAVGEDVLTRSASAWHPGSNVSSACPAPICASPISLGTAHISSSSSSSRPRAKQSAPRPISRASPISACG
jgi:L-alanine-DL-glutamate epimerase-like enolase superfamily enzyme